MEFIELEQVNKTEYNRFVAEQSSGSFLQSWEWGEWQKSLGHEVRRFGLTEAKVLMATVQCVKTNLFNKQHYAYASYGPVWSTSLAEADFKFFITSLHKQYPGALFIRIEPLIAPQGLLAIGKKSKNIQPGITMIVDVNKTDDELLALMHPKTRYNIKIAERYGVEIQSEMLVT